MWKGYKKNQPSVIRWLVFFLPKCELLQIIVNVHYGMRCVGNFVISISRRLGTIRVEIVEDRVKMEI